METSDLFPMESEPTSSRLASHASRTHVPGSDWARKMTELSGLSLARSLRESSPIGSLLRMLLASSVWRSTACYLTWRLKATKQGRSYYQLAPSTRHTGGIESGLWHTPRASEAEHPGRKSTAHGRQTGLAEQVNNSVLFPTPSAREPGWRHIEIEDKHGNPPEHWNQRFYDKKTGRVVQKGLTQIARMFPTPRATQGRGKTGNRTPEDANRAGWTLSEVAMLLPTPTANRWDGLQSHGVNVVEGSLNPDWVEWLMGYPEGWTDISTASQTSRESPKACQTAPTG